MQFFSLLFCICMIIENSGTKGRKEEGGKTDKLQLSFFPHFCELEWTSYSTKYNPMCSEILIKNVTTLIGKNLQKILLNQCDSEKNCKTPVLKKNRKSRKTKRVGGNPGKKEGDSEIHSEWQYISQLWSKMQIPYIICWLKLWMYQVAEY